jgi:hypothetical protein
MAFVIKKAAASKEQVQAAQASAPVAEVPRVKIKAAPAPAETPAYDYSQPNPLTGQPWEKDPVTGQYFKDPASRGPRPDGLEEWDIPVLFKRFPWYTSDHLVRLVRDFRFLNGPAVEAYLAEHPPSGADVKSHHLKEPGP